MYRTGSQIHQPEFKYLDDAQASIIGVLPSTRYQGSKHKLLKWIDYCTRDLSFDSVLDAFGGTGCVGYMYKQNGKQVFYNDALSFNRYIGLALIENSGTLLENQDIEFILEEHPSIAYPTFIRDTFHDIYFTDTENQWLDVVVTNIRQIEDRYKQAIAFYALFQSCIAKRPYNLFHRKNLYIRTANVERNFGNKKTWDTPFADHFRKFAEEAHNAIFDNGEKNKAFHSDILALNIPHPDLVYIDTPYISSRGIGVNYFDFYHFLEGIVAYERWGALIDDNSKHKKLKTSQNEWCNKKEIHKAFEKLFDKFKDSILVVSYREDGIPCIPDLVRMLESRGKKVDVKMLDYKYVLSTGISKEVLIIGQ